MTTRRVGRPREIAAAVALCGCGSAPEPSAGTAAATTAPAATAPTTPAATLPTPDRLVVTGFADDPYACLAAGADTTSSRLVEMVVGGAVDAHVDPGGDVDLAGEQFVIRLTPSPAG